MDSKEPGDTIHDYKSNNKDFQHLSKLYDEMRRHQSQTQLAAPRLPDESKMKIKSNGMACEHIDAPPVLLKYIK